VTPNLSAPLNYSLQAGDSFEGEYQTVNGSYHGDECCISLNVHDIYFTVDNVSVSATPLPAAFPLFATGLGALGLLGWRKKRKNAAAVAAT
jgi:hypothetical protein